MAKKKNRKSHLVFEDRTVISGKKAECSTRRGFSVCSRQAKRAHCHLEQRHYHAYEAAERAFGPAFLEALGVHKIDKRKVRLLPII